MIDFTVPPKPGRTERSLKWAEAEDGDIGAISPKMLRAIDKLQGAAHQEHQDLDVSDYVTLVAETVQTEKKKKSVQRRDLEKVH